MTVAEKLSEINRLKQELDSLHHNQAYWENFPEFDSHKSRLSTNFY